MSKNTKCFTSVIGDGVKHVMDASNKRMTFDELFVV